jgi:hypothetical protein
MAARLASGMPPGLGPGARAAILSEAEAKERAAPEKFQARRMLLERQKER